LPIDSGLIQLESMQMKKIFKLLIIIMSFWGSAFAGDMPIRIKQGMLYTKAREILINDGWQTVTAHTTGNGMPICYRTKDMDPYTDPEYKQFNDSEECNYPEVDDCSGTGMGFCKMNFYDGERTYLTVVTDGGPPPDGEIYSWRKGKAPELSDSVPNNNDSASYSFIGTTTTGRSVFADYSRMKTKGVRSYFFFPIKSMDSNNVDVYQDYWIACKEREAKAKSLDGTIEKFPIIGKYSVAVLLEQKFCH
jgi:hypothetical protein